MSLVSIQKPTIHVLHHADSDGRFGGYAAWRKLRNDGKLSKTQFYEVQYGKPFPLDVEQLTKDDHVYIIDFSYNRTLMDQVHEKVGKLVVLEHHETAEEQLGDASYVIYDVTKSGALLAWEYFFPLDQPPAPCLLVNDFDLWQKKYGDDTAAFEAWLRFDRVGQNWEKWENLCYHQQTFEQAMLKGDIVARYNKSIMASFISNQDNITLSSLFHEGIGKRIRYAIFNGAGILHSELSEAVYTKFEVDLTISWRVKGKDVAFSIRSPNPDHVSAKEFAATYGGGGHKASSGFGLPLDKGMELIKHLMSKA